MNKIFERKSIRLKRYDYSCTGYYFITVCVNNRELILGEIKNDCRGTACRPPNYALNKYGQIVYDEWINTGKLRENVELDEFIVMPNHFHGIVVINESLGTEMGTARRAPMGDGVICVCRGTACRAQNYATKEKFGKPVGGSLSTIMRSFKSAVTKQINESRNMPGAQFWQRNYYEHVIRDDKDLADIREYIVNNPVKWQEDEYYVK